MIVKAANQAYAVFRKLDVADNVRVALCTLPSVCIDYIPGKISKLSHYVLFRLFTLACFEMGHQFTAQVHFTGFCWRILLYNVLKL